MSGTNAPGGWYPDPSNGEQQRYWDGTDWTDQTRPVPPPPPPPPVPPPPTPPPGMAGAGGYAPPPPPRGGAFPPPPGPSRLGYGVPHGGLASGPPPPNYLAPAILATVFCCLPAGIVAIVKAAQVNTLWERGDAAGARAASASAKQWAIISAVAAVVVVIPWIALVAADGG